MTAPTDGRVQWVEEMLGRELSDFHRRCVVLICQAMRCGPYDFSRTFETAEWNWGSGVRFRIERPQFATYDTDGLTALVFGAHDEAIRVEITPATFRHLDVTMHPRRRDAAGQWARHPSLEHAMKTWTGKDRSPIDYASTWRMQRCA